MMKDELVAKRIIKIKFNMNDANGNLDIKKPLPGKRLSIWVDKINTCTCLP